jgi:predicted cobalt transporter CbtA
MNTARGPAVPNSLFVWKVRLWLLALGVALVVNDHPMPAPQRLQAQAPAALIACRVPASARQLVQRASHTPQAKDCPPPDHTANPTDL